MAIRRLAGRGRRTESLYFTLESDTVLYLREGSDRCGAALHENDDLESGNTNSRIQDPLAACVCACVVDLGPLTGEVRRSGQWTGDCDSTNREDRHLPMADI